MILKPKNQELVRIMNYEIMKYKDSLYYEMSKEWASIPAIAICGIAKWYHVIFPQKHITLISLGGWVR